MPAGGTWTNGAADRDLGTTGNWSVGTPTANDDAIFTGEYTSADSGPNTGMADLDGVDLNLVLVTSEYTQPIGTIGAPMQCSADKVEHYGQNTLFYKDGATVITDHFLCDVARAVTGVGGSPVKSFELSGTATTLLSLIRGQGEILASSEVTTIHVGQMGVSAPGTTLTIGASCTITTCRCFGGVVTCSTAPSGSVEVFAGGTWTQDTATISTLYVFPGARVNLGFTGTYTTVQHELL